jgi:hypothetical protein
MKKKTERKKKKGDITNSMSPEVYQKNIMSNHPSE